MRIKSKLPDTGISIFAVMSALAVKHNAINLSQGFPDFNCDDELLDLFNKYLREGKNQYAPMPGIPSIRERISEKIEKLYGKNYSPDDEITITAGATQALYTAITSIIHKDDEAILFEPAYDSYAPAILSNGGKPVFIPLLAPEFTYDWDRVKDAITARTKLIIINSPHNPTGSVISYNDIQILEEITQDKNIFVISDEVYEHIIFDNLEHFSVSKFPKLSERSFVISSFGKTYHATGWKVGYCAAPKHLSDEVRKIHQFVTFAVNTPAQFAYADYMKDESKYLTLNNFYQEKRDLMIQYLSGSKFRLTPAKGTYFQLLDYSNISDMNDMEFSLHLTKEKGVAVIPLSPFCKDGSNEKLIRICFAKRDEVLQDAAEKLKQL